MKKKMPKPGDQIEFNITNPNWANPLPMRGVVEAVEKKFEGMICVSKGAVTEEQVLIRLNSLK